MAKATAYQQQYKNCQLSLTNSFTVAEGIKYSIAVLIFLQHKN